MAAEQSHFTAVVKISHTSITPILDPRRSTPTPSGAESRLVREVVTITVRADSIEALVKKTQAHLALVED